MEKLIEFFKRFWVIPTDLKGGFRFQINIPIGRKNNKRKRVKNV